MRSPAALRRTASYILLTLTALAAARSSATEPDAMFRGGPKHDGVYGPATSGVLGVDFPLKWRFKTAGKIRSTPVVAGGTVFVGSGDGHLYAVAADSGTLRWKFATGGDLSSSPAVTGDQVVFVGGDRALYSLDRVSGELRWKVESGPALTFEWSPGDPRIFDYYGPSPTIGGGVAYVGNNDGHVYAVDVKSGQVRWKHDAKHWVHGAPAIADGLVLAGNYDGECFALDATTGERRWTYRIERDPNTGGPVTLVGAPAVQDGRVFFTSNVPTYVVALEVATGKLLWRTEHPGSMIYASPALAGGLVLVGSSDAHIFQALDARTGKEQWHHDTRARVLTSAMVADGLVYFGNTAAYLTVLSLADGQPRGMTYTEASIHSSAVLHDGTLYVGSDDDHLYAFERKLRIAAVQTPLPTWR